MNRAAAIFASLAYWLLALLFLLFTQIGDVNAAGTVSPAEAIAALDMRRRNGIIVLCVELGIYAALFLVVRNASRRRR
jgi:hypothetical protein